MCSDRAYVCCICPYREGCEYRDDPYNYDLPPMIECILDCLGSK